jgi:hypothetical protein
LQSILPAKPDRGYPPKQPDLKRIYVTSAVIALLLVYGVFAARLLNNPAESKTMDFMAYYTAARIARQQGLPHIYDLDLQRQIEVERLGSNLAQEQFLPYIHPPYIVPLLEVLFDQDFETSFLRWMLCLAGVSLFSVRLLSRMLPEHPRPWRKLLCGSMLFFPVFISITQGQDTAFMLLGLSIFLWGMSNKHETLAGWGLSLLTLRPQMALFFILPVFFWSRNAFWAYLTGCATLTIASIAMLGRQGTLDFIDILRISSGGDGYGTNEAAMLNLLGLARRLFPAMASEPARQAAWGIFLLATAGTSLFFAISKMDKPQKFGLCVLVFLMTSPHFHYHDLSLMLAPAIILIHYLSRDKPAAMPTAGVVAASFSLVMMLSNKTPLFFYGMPYVLAGFLIAGLLIYPKISADLPPSQPVII